MAGLTSILNAARDALSAQTYGLDVTSQNINNASTDLYVRREAVLQTNANGGVTIQGSRRAADIYADCAFFNASSSQASASAYDSELTSIENVFTDSSDTGFGSTLDKMFSAFQQLSASPTDATVRQSALDAADVFAKRANDIGNTLASQKTDLYNKATELTQSANQTLQEVATLNQQIVNERLAGRDASTLIDQRNMKLKELSLVTDFSVIAGANDGISIQVGGTSLVDGATSSSLGVALDSAGKMAITVQGNSGTPSTADITSSISGGQLFAVQQARDVDLTQVSARFDQFVYDLATVINTQHAAGVGLDGQSGRDLFDISASSDGAARSITLSNDVAGKPEALAAAANSAELPGGSANAVLLNKLGSSSVISGNSKTPAQAYADIVGDVGNRRAASKADVALRQDILTQAQTARESTSGVSLDEEMVNLQKYERAYQAAGKVLTAADQLLQELLQRIGA